MEPVPASDPIPPAPDGRLSKLVPVVRGLIGRVRTVGVVSAVSAVVLWVIVFGAAAWPLGVETIGALIALAILLLPAGGTFLAVLTLREVLDLPARLRALPGRLRDAGQEATAGASGVVRPEGEKRSRRLFGFVGVLWRLRGAMGDTQGTLARTVALARAARLASLPFVLALAVAFALDFVVIAAAVVAVVVALV